MGVCVRVSSAVLTCPGCPGGIRRGTSGSPTPPRCGTHQGQTGRQQAEEAAAATGANTEQDLISNTDIYINGLVFLWDVLRSWYNCKARHIYLYSACHTRGNSMCFTSLINQHSNTFKNSLQRENAEKRAAGSLAPMSKILHKPPYNATLLLSSGHRRQFTM